MQPFATQINTISAEMAEARRAAEMAGQQTEPQQAGAPQQAEVQQAGAPQTVQLPHASTQPQQTQQAFTCQNPQQFTPQLFAPQPSGLHPFAQPAQHPALQPAPPFAPPQHVWPTQFPYQQQQMHVQYPQQQPALQYPMHPGQSRPLTPIEQQLAQLAAEGERERARQRALDREREAQIAYLQSLQRDTR